MRIFRNALIAMCMSPMLGICMGAPFYIAEPIEAWVVDAETGQPIEGAVVTANWQLVTGGLDGPRYKGQLEVKEAVTDKNGRFFIEGFTKVNPALDELRNDDPQILIFRAGYKYQRIINMYDDAGTKTPGIKRKAAVSGTTVKLKRVPEQSWFDARVVPYDGLDIWLHRVIEGCGWKQIPRMIRATDVEYKRVRDLKTNRLADLPTITVLEGYVDKCGSAKAFFGEVK